MQLVVFFIPGRLVRRVFKPEPALSLEASEELV